MRRLLVAALVGLWVWCQVVPPTNARVAVGGSPDGQIERHCDTRLKKIASHVQALEARLAAIHDDADGLPLHSVAEGSFLGLLKELSATRSDLRLSVTDFDRYECERKIFVDGFTDIDILGASADEFVVDQQGDDLQRPAAAAWSGGVATAERRLLHARRWLDTHDDNSVDVHSGATSRLGRRTKLNMARLKHLLVRTLGYSEAAQVEEWLIPLLSTDVVVGTRLPMTVAHSILDAAVQLNGGKPIP